MIDFILISTYIPVRPLWELPDEAAHFLYVQWVGKI